MVVLLGVVGTACTGSQNAEVVTPPELLEEPPDEELDELELDPPDEELLEETPPPPDEELEEDVVPPPPEEDVVPPDDELEEEELLEELDDELDEELLEDELLELPDDELPVPLPPDEEDEALGLELSSWWSKQALNASDKNDNGNRLNTRRARKVDRHGEFI